MSIKSGILPCVVVIIASIHQSDRHLVVVAGLTTHIHCHLELYRGVSLDACHKEFYLKQHMNIMQIHIDNISVDDGFDALGYNYENNNSGAYDVAVRGECRLWCAVIHQAFADLENENENLAAKLWLLRDKTDFPLVCFLAGMSPHVVRKAALEKMRMLLEIKS